MCLTVIVFTPRALCDHVTPLLNDLHWLSVAEHITYKLCVLV